MSKGGTASYRELDQSFVVPPLVGEALDAAERIGFELCVRPEIGRLLGVLAGGLPPGSVVGETGTGTGAGLAWMISHAAPGSRFVSYELDPGRAEAARGVFADHPEATVVTGDAAGLFDHGPFDLLVLDGGPASGKAPGHEPADVSTALRRGGLVTIDDYTPATEWPPTFAGEIDHSRMHWLTHPDLQSTEVRVAPDLAVVVGRRR